MGIADPKMPLIKQLMVMARNTTTLNLNATGLFSAKLALIPQTLRVLFSPRSPT
jgi:hypothetical protein